MKIEPVTKAQVDSLIRAMGGMSAMICGIYDADLSLGRGVLEGDERCLWTKDKKRITITPIYGGGVIASLSKDTDPEAPESGK